MAKEIQTGAMMSAMETVQEFVQENIRQISAIALVVIVVAAFIGFWQYQKITSESRANVLLNSALAILTAEPGKDVDSTTRFSKVLERFKQIEEKYPSTPAGAAALMYAGMMSYKLKMYEEAISFYNDFLKRADDAVAFLKPSAYEGLGYVYESQGEYQQALEWFEKQHGEQDGENSEALMNMARCYELKGDNVNACEAYKTFVKKTPSSSFVEIANIKIRSLCSEGM